MHFYQIRAKSLKVVGGPFSKPSPSTAMSLPTLTNSLKDILDERKDTDVTFHISGEDIFAHKFILSLRSSVLKTMVNNPMAYVDGKILISDPAITVDDFKDFLRFLYSDECEITRDNLEIMLHLGNMYDVPLLLENCAEFVETNLNASNLLEYAEIGLIYADNCSILSKCLKRIPFYFFDYRSPLQNPPIYYYSPDFSLRELSSGLVLKIVQDSNRIGNFTEEKLFEAVLDWAQEMCLSTYNEEAATMSTNMKEILKDIIPFIKFEKLKPLTLATNVKEYDLLSTEDQLDALQKSVINDENRNNFDGDINRRDDSYSSPHNNYYIEHESQNPMNNQNGENENNDILDWD